MHAGGTGMNNAFWNALVIKVGDLFAEDEILEQRRAARIGPEGILIVRQREALVRREAGMPCKVSVRRAPLLPQPEGVCKIG